MCFNGVVQAPFLGLHTGPSPGEATLRFPAEVVLHNLWEDRQLGPSRRFTLQTGTGATYLFRLAAPAPRDDGKE